MLVFLVLVAAFVGLIAVKAYIIPFVIVCWLCFSEGGHEFVSNVIEAVFETLSGLCKHLASAGKQAAFRAEHAAQTNRVVCQQAQEAQNSQKNFESRKRARIAARTAQTENRNASEGLRNRVCAEKNNLMRDFAKWKEQSASEWREILNRANKAGDPANRRLSPGA